MEKSVEYPKVFGSLVKLKNKGKGKAQKLVEKSSSWPGQWNSSEYLGWKKKEIEKQIGLLAEIINLNVIAEEE